MNQFTFEARTRMTLGIFMIVGVLCLLLAGLTDGMRFWSNYLHNSVFFLGIGFISLFILTAFTTAYAGWHTVIKRVWESFSMFLIPGLILMLVVIAGLWLGWHNLYHWAHEPSVETDTILQGKSGFLNKTWYTLGTIIIVAVWIWFAIRYRKLSVAIDESAPGDYKAYKRTQLLSAIFLPIAGFTSAALIWQWVMSVDAHWYSTLFAWYTTASWFVAAMCLTIMLLIWLKGKGYFAEVTADHFHDLGKYVFAISIFWTYLWFSQYMLIWYGNVGEETVYFRTRQEEYPVLFWGNLLLNFVLPFFVLMRNDTKRKYGTLFFVALFVFLGHWWDFFQMIKPGVAHTVHEIHLMEEGHGDHHHDGETTTLGQHDEGAHQEDDSHGAEAHAVADHGEGGHGEEDHGDGHHGSTFQMGTTIPGFLELGTLLGFLAGFLYFVLSAMARSSTVPENDPYIEESRHHTVWPY